ncbi:hypothetical protein AALP_AA3G106200 [Arabis alpina]|uniref:PPM-type phosphatase domain-containing protein n=1 Tax=Arabis alpina TaxID=50452 RepID=A0A087H8C8_ARAAL|nr:hypothetical protein AALP_AA3G106200 [Arabis alpina]
MSQLLVRIAKISSSSVVKKKHGLCFSELRSFSSAATPYLLLQPTEKEATTPSGEAMVDLNVYDPRKDETVKFPDQTLTKELLTSLKARSSRGWVLAKNKVESTWSLTNMFNPCAAASTRKVISLPPTKYQISGISLSASPEKEDCVVAAMSLCSSIIMCRPGDSEWTPVMVPMYTSGMIYSERHGKFYLNKRLRGNYNGPVDFVDTSSGFPQMSLYQPSLIDPNSDFPFSDIPQSRVELHSTDDDLTMVHHIVESPSGEIFIVYWFNEYLDFSVEFEKLEAAHAKAALDQSSIIIKPKGFAVFRPDPEQMIGSYTEDIGDLCIFLGSNEAFCVSASEYPGLKPNSIYFASPSTGFTEYLDLNIEKSEASRAKEPPYQSSTRKKHKGFVVFRQDPEQRINTYTEDIGDLCIFLGSNEAFCISASEYPGLKPNSSTSIISPNISDHPLELSMGCLMDINSKKKKKVFDGHGGVDAASFTKKNILKLVMEDKHFPTNTKKATRSAFVKTDHALADAPSLDRSPGTTALTALILDKTMLIANAGDSRAVLGKRGRAIELSKDHKPNCTSERLRIEKLGGVIYDGYQHLSETFI